MIALSLREFFENNDDLREKLKKSEKSIFLYGTGNGADKVIDDFNSRGIEISGVFVSDGFCRDRTFRGFKVKTLSDVQNENADFIAALSFGSDREEVIKNVDKIAEKYEYYAVDVPVYGDNIFDREFVNKNIDKIELARTLFYDGESREIYDNMVKFKFTGRREFLKKCESDSVPFEFKKGEKYLDLGAYNGDTVLSFVNSCPDYSFITALEPDGKNFKKLEKNTENLRDIRLINACVSDFDGESYFTSAKGRGGSSDNGKIPVKAVSVDSILKNEDVTYLKADVEGAESKAVDGMREIILRCKPKMKIACYHRSEDIFSLIIKVMNIRSDYKAFIRHTPHTLGWDTDLYFV